MQALTFARSGLAQTLLVSLLTLAAVALLGAVLAYWTWVWIAPRAAPRAEPIAAQAGISLASAATIFGSAPRRQEQVVTSPIAARLLGVVAAAKGRRGYAVLQLESKEIVAVHEGNEIAAGVRLVEVRPNQVVLEREGARETLAWPEPPAAKPAAARAARS